MRRQDDGQTGELRLDFIAFALRPSSVRGCPKRVMPDDASVSVVESFHRSWQYCRTSGEAGKPRANERAMCSALATKTKCGAKRSIPIVQVQPVTQVLTRERLAALTLAHFRS